MLLSMQNIDKSFSGVSALQDSWLEIEEGEIMALVGQNGAGKSTLIKILTGVYTKNGGTIKFDQKSTVFASPAQSQAAGIATIYQEILEIDSEHQSSLSFLAEFLFGQGRLKEAGLPV